MMKTAKYIFLWAFAALLAIACVREEEFSGDTPDIEAKSGDTVVIDGSLCLPAINDMNWGTKAFTETPEVKRLYLAVFNAGDILYEIAQAKPGTQSHPSNPDAGFPCGSKATNYLTQFHVELGTVSQGDRYIHFIATSEPIASLESGTVNMMDEATFVHDLVTTNEVVAYWGRIHVTAIMESSADDPNFHNIKMIRNFAKVKVKTADDVDNFEILGFKVFDTPVYGTIAPFNNNTVDYIPVDGNIQINFNRFADFVTASTQDSPYSFLTTSLNYYGFMPPTIAYDDNSSYYDASGTDNVPWIDPADPDYLYECSYRPDRNPFIILKANYTEGGSTNLYYYKADFVYNTADGNEYYNLLRNFQYTLNITGVSGKGSSTVYDAINSIALNNFEASTLAQELTNIANDDSRLYISQTDILITYGTTLTMYVKSRKGDGFTQDDNGTITAEIREATSGNNIVADDSDITISGSDETSGDYSGWRKVTMNIQDAASLQPGEVWKQPIVFKNAAGLTRTVNITLRRPMSLTVDMQDVVAGTKNTECELKFSIPSGLTEYRFPMYFYIEQESNNLYPKALADGANEALTVITGKSKIPGNETKNTYYYRRAISWSEYMAADADIAGIKTFSCYFKTLQDASATTVWVFPADENNYYYPYDDVENEYTNRDSFLNDKLTGEVEFPYYGLQLAAGESQTVAATGNSGGDITYVSSNTSVATVNSSGKVTAVAAGTATITAILAETGSYTGDSDSYTVNVTSGTPCGLTVNWYNEPTYIVKVGSTIKAPIAVGTCADGYSGTISISYTTSPSGLVSIDETDAETNKYVTVRGLSAGIVTVTATATASDNGSFAGTSRSINYDIQIVSASAESGTIYHEESFLGPTIGDYTLYYEKVTDGATYTAGTDKTALFNTWTTYNAGTDYRSRHVWYPYYNFQTQAGFGLAASGYGSTEEPTTTWDDEQGRYVTDYHEQCYASHAQLASKSIDLSCSNGATLYFYHCGNYFYNTATEEDIADAKTLMAGDVGVRFSADGGSSWSEKQTIKFYPAGSNWIYIKTSVDIPAAYLTTDFRLMFDYTSTDSRAGTWEIKNVQIREN